MTASLPTSAETVIIGGGAMGCSLAYHLAASGRRPLLLERDSLGSGSTGRCAGGVRQQFSTAVNVRLGQRAIELLSEFQELTGVDPLYRPIGYLLLATSERLAAELAEEVQLQRELGVLVELLERPELAPLTKGVFTDDVVAASYCPSDGLAGPNELVSGYAQAARRLGATLVEGSEVVGLRLRQDRVVSVCTSSGEVATAEVVICAGPQAGTVGRMAGLELPIVPLRRHIVLTDPFPEWAPDGPMTIDRATGFYFHPEGDGVLMGMGDASQAPGDDLSVNWDFLPSIMEEGIRRLPALAESGMRTAWAGLYEMTPDRQPLVGRATGAEGIWLCCGFSGHGFMMSLPVGEALSRLICGSSPAGDLSPFSPARFSMPGAVPERVFV